MKHTTMSRLCAVLASALVPALAARAAGPPAPSYRVTQAVNLGTPDRWDYVVYDATTHNVYVAHGDRVTVVDGRGGKIVGSIEGLPGGTHGIAISTATGQGYTDDGEGAVAAAFSLATLKITQKIKTGDDADAIALDPASGHVFVVDGDPGELTVIDPKVNAVVATIKVGAKLEFIVADGAGKAFVNGEAKNEIVRVDTHGNRVDAHWPMPGCESPHGLAIDVTARRLFSSCANGVLAVVNADSGALVATVPIGNGTDAAAFDPKRKLVYSSNGRDGTITVIREQDPQHYAVVATIKTAVTGRTMGIDPDSGRLYVAAAEVDASAAATPAASPTAAVAAVGAATPAPRRRLPLVPGSLRLLFIDPTP
jgi:YVTN family beta-propeller protein